MTSSDNVGFRHPGQIEMKGKMEKWVEEREKCQRVCICNKKLLLVRALLILGCNRNNKRE